MKGLAVILIAPTLYLASPALAQSQNTGSTLPPMTVYKNPSCGCCSKWIEHVERYGFTVKTYTTKNPNALKDRLGVPENMRSCHVGVIGDYLFEGHVPADLIEKFLAERPNTAGLAVPGMVVGSPGMEGHNPQHYDVVAFTKEGRHTVYASR